MKDHHTGQDFPVISNDQKWDNKYYKSLGALDYLVLLIMVMWGMIIIGIVVGIVLLGVL